MPMMRRLIAMIVLVTLLGCGWGWAQTSSPDAAPLPGAMAAAPEPAYADLLARLRSAARQSDNDVMALRIERWKAHSRTRQQLLDTASSIHRNLAYAVPELLQHAAAEPDSLKATFVLYRDLTVLYETFSGLAESAGAFGPSDSYDMLAGDLSQLNQLRHELADRLEHMSAAADARLLHGRAKDAAVPGKIEKAPASSSFHKIIVDPNHREHHGKKKPVKRSTTKRTTQ
jgi:hypothetical protein